MTLTFHKPRNNSNTGPVPAIDCAAASKRKSAEGGTVAILTRFAVLSIGSVVVNVTLTYFLTELADLPSELSFFTAMVFTFFMNFAGCRTFVFTADNRPVVRQMGAFLASTAGFRAVEYFAFLCMHTLLAINYLASTVGILFASFCVKFVFYNRFVFGKSKRT